jgi:SAM-dependent methyltransferase
VIDDHLAMSELLRVLKPGGWASLLVPIRGDLETTYEDFSIVSSQDRLKHFGQEDHVRWYGRDYQHRLERAGFNVNVEAYAQEFTDDLIEKYGLDIAEDLFIGIKPGAVETAMPPLELYKPTHSTNQTHDHSLSKLTVSDASR